MIPVIAEKENTRTTSMLRCAPGLSVFADLGTNAPIRGARNVEGLYLAVSSNKLFKVDPNGSPTLLGTIPGVSRVSMAHNQITGGNEVAISNGTSGYVYNTVTNTLVQITDDGFPGAKSFEYLDSYILGVEPGGRFGFTSDLASATSYNTLDQYEAEGSPDALVGQIVSHREWWLMGERTIEIFGDTGAATGTFQRTTGTGIEVGLASPFAMANLDNSVFWLGSDGVVYRANGYTPMRVSTHPIEQAISHCTMSSAFAFTYEDRGHKIFYLTFKDGQTWGFDVATQEWHRRQSRDLNRWRINTLTNWSGKWIAGDFSNGLLYEMDWDVQSEAGVPMERRRISGVLSDSQNAVIVNAIQLVVDTGQPVKEAKSSVLAISGDVPDGYVGSPISGTYVANGAISGATFAITSGSMPSGMTLLANGSFSGTPTTIGHYAWTVQVTDGTGRKASFGDRSVIYSIMDPQLTDWRYIVTSRSDNTNRSAPDYDDSAWAVGTAPFGNITIDPSVGTNAHAFNSKFRSTIATQVPGAMRTWLRRKLTLQDVPPSGYVLVGYFDNAYKLYLNGVLASDGSTLTNAGVTVIVPAKFFISGDNVIAVQCDDFAPPCYFDFFLRPSV
jgi:hypothetical protein